MRQNSDKLDKDSKSTTGTRVRRGQEPVSASDDEDEVIASPAPRKPTRAPWLLLLITLPVAAFWMKGLWKDERQDCKESWADAAARWGAYAEAKRGGQDIAPLYLGAEAARMANLVLADSRVLADPLLLDSKHDAGTVRGAWRAAQEVPANQDDPRYADAMAASRKAKSICQSIENVPAQTVKSAKASVDPSSSEYTVVPNPNPFLTDKPAVPVAPVQPESPEMAGKELIIYVAKLLALAQAVNGVKWPVTKKCADSDIGESGAVYAAEEESLTALIRGTNGSKGDSGWTLWRTFFGPKFAKIAEAKAKNELASGAGWTTEAIRGWNAARQLVVVRSERRSMPALTRYSGGPLMPDEFIWGEFKGWLFVGDIRAGKVLCQSPLSFRSSATIEWTGTKEERNDFRLIDSKIQLDFVHEAERAMRAALESIAPKLTLRL